MRLYGRGRGNAVTVGKDRDVYRTRSFPKGDVRPPVSDAPPGCRGVDMNRCARSDEPLRRTLVLVLTAGLTALGLSAPRLAHADTTPAPGVPATVSADGLPRGRSTVSCGARSWSATRSCDQELQRGQAAGRSSGWRRRDRRGDREAHCHRGPSVSKTVLDDNTNLGPRGEI